MVDPMVDASQPDDQTRKPWMFVAPLRVCQAEEVRKPRLRFLLDRWYLPSTPTWGDSSLKMLIFLWGDFLFFFRFFVHHVISPVIL